MHSIGVCRIFAEGPHCLTRSLLLVCHSETVIEKVKRAASSAISSLGEWAGSPWRQWLPINMLFCFDYCVTWCMALCEANTSSLWCGSLWVLQLMNSSWDCTASNVFGRALLVVGLSHIIQTTHSMAMPTAAAVSLPCPLILSQVLCEGLAAIDDFR